MILLFLFQMNVMISKTLKPPYYAVIFTSVLEEEHIEYHDTAIKMVEMAKEVDGFLGIESAREEIGISVSYWKDLESIQKWREHSEHRLAKNKGIEKWYKSYALRIAKVEKDNFFER